MSKPVDVEAEIRKVARANVAPAPDGHKGSCMCDECVQHKARVEVESERIARSAMAGVREVEQADAEFEHYVAGRVALGEARDVAAGAGMVRKKLRAGLEGHLRRAAQLVDQAGGERMQPEAFRQFSRASTRAAELAETDRALEGLEARAVAVVSESRVYGPQSRASWFLDLALRADLDPSVNGPARERQARYASELRYEARRGSVEGRRVVLALHEKARCEREEIHRESETRAVGTDGGISASAAGEAASMVSPYFIDEAFALYRGKARSFADQCGTWPMPPYGLRVYVPFFATAASASEQAEGQAVADSSPTTALESATLETVSGQVIVSQQIHDRAMAAGGAFDIVIGKQINQQLEEAVDLYCLNQAITNGQSVSGQSSFSIANLYQDIALGREVLTDTGGTRLRPTHFFSSSDMYSYITRQVDDQHRPIVVPTFAAGFPISNGADGGAQDGSLPKWSRFTGTVLPAGVLWFENESLPVVGTTNHARLIVSAPEEAILLCESPEPILTSSPEYGAAHLQVLVNSRKYVAAVTRHASGTASISSAAYTTSLI